MILRRLVVFSGFDARIVERIRPELEAQHCDVVVVKRWPILTIEYFQKLLGRLATVANRQFENPDVRLVALLVSNIEDEETRALEDSTFKPMLRRLMIDPSMARDVERTPELSGRIIALITGEEFLSTYDRIRPATDATLALPLKNAANRRLEREITSLYDLLRFQPTAGLDRYIRRLKKGRGLRSKDIDFCGCLNDPSHPIRRRTDSIHCDMNGRFRLGFSIPPRFEFDVTCETGLTGKTFQQCDGARVKIPAKATHLNMRINDDFDW